MAKPDNPDEEDDPTNKDGESGSGKNKDASGKGYTALDPNTIRFKGKVNCQRTNVQRLIKTLQETGGKWKLQMDPVEDSARIEVTKETTLEDTEAASRLYELIRSAAGAGLGQFELSYQ